MGVSEDPARQYVVSRAVYRLCARLMEILRSNDMSLRADLKVVVREAMAVGRWYEQASVREAEHVPPPEQAPKPKVIVARELWEDDDDAITLPSRPR